MANIYLKKNSMTEQSDNIAELLTLTMTVNEWGTLIYRNSLGQLHRQYGPAIEWADGDKSWYLNNKRHRTDGPAVECANGDMHWCLDGKQMTEEEFHDRTK